MTYHLQVKANFMDVPYDYVDWYISFKRIGVIHPILQPFCEKAIKSNYFASVINHNFLLVFDKLDGENTEVLRFTLSQVLEKIFP